MVHPKLTGDKTTLAVALALVDAGYDVSLPFGENCRYDLVADRDGTLARIQCKTGRLRDGAILFATASTYGHLPSPREARRAYRGQIDYFGVYCPGTAGVYLVPIDAVPTSSGAHLRVTSPRNGQRRRIRFAEEFRVGSVCLRSARARLPTTASPQSDAPAGHASATSTCHSLRRR
jgi:hypothetical protein